MDALLLATKLRVPPQPQRAVFRPRLIDALEHAIPHYPLVRLAAPAGYGKTTLLAQWAHASRLQSPGSRWATRTTTSSVSSLSAGGLGGAATGRVESPVGLRLGAMLPDTEAVLSAFLNLASELPTRSCLCSTIII